MLALRSRFSLPAAVLFGLGLFEAGCTLDTQGQFTQEPQNPEASLSETTPADNAQPPPDSAEAALPDGGSLEAALPDGSSGDVDSEQPQEPSGCQHGALQCTQSVAQQCVNGAWQTLESCPLGCHSVEPRCNRIKASNDIKQEWITGSKAGQSPFNPSVDVIIDTDSGAISPNLPGELVTNVSGEYDCGGGHKKRMRVFSFTEVNIPEGVTVRVRGNNALAIVASGKIVIRGTIDAHGGRKACLSADLWCAGPGGFEGGRSASQSPSAGEGPGGGGAGFAQQPADNDETGGGGAGYGALGGAGGDETDGPRHSGGSQGKPYGKDSLVPLCGGSGGGAGGGGVGWTNSSHGGGGGGAVQLVSAQSVEIQCTAAACGVWVSGAGGQADHDSTYDDGGGGGGSGGAVLIEAPSVTIGPNALISAAGGGGAGGYNNEQNCIDGQDGPFSTAQAAGGGGVAAGGMGGGDVTPQGAAGTGYGDGTAGGGGAAGRIRVNSFNAASIQGGPFNPRRSTNLATTGSIGVE
jgi:hypothetical protein